MSRPWFYGLIFISAGTLLTGCSPYGGRGCPNCGAGASPYASPGVGYGAPAYGPAPYGAPTYSQPPAFGGGPYSGGAQVLPSSPTPVYSAPAPIQGPGIQ